MKEAYSKLKNPAFLNLSAEGSRKGCHPRPFITNHYQLPVESFCVLAETLLALMFSNQCQLERI